MAHMLTCAFLSGLHYGDFEHRYIVAIYGCWYNESVAGNRHDVKIKDAVSRLRSLGKTYAQIQQIHPIAKSTLSVWLGKRYGNLYTRDIQLAHLKKARLVAAESIRRAKEERDSIARGKGLGVAKRLNLKNIDVLKAMLSMIYWAEGSKHKTVHGLNFANTDPRFALLYVTLLRKCFVIDEKRLRIRLHLHHYHEREKARQYWSSLLAIPTTQFWKIYYKKRSKKKRFRKNSMGICFVYYPDNSARKEILAIGIAVHDILSAQSLP